MDEPPATTYAKLALIALIGVHGSFLAANPSAWSFLDGVDLLIHEAGHVVFAPFGEFVEALGGTLMQLLIPILFTIHFLRQGQRFAAMVTLFWVAQNLFNISVYVRDARTQSLPLIGGGEHDWAYLLDRLGLLSHDQLLSGVVRVAGVLLYIYSVVQGYSFAREESVVRA